MVSVPHFRRSKRFPRLADFVTAHTRASPAALYRRRLQRGELDPERWLSYRKLAAESAYAKNAEQSAYAKEKKFKAIAKLNKQMKKR